MIHSAFTDKINPNFYSNENLKVIRYLILYASFCGKDMMYNLIVLQVPFALYFLAFKQNLTQIINV